MEHSNNVVFLITTKTLHNCWFKVKGWWGAAKFWDNILRLFCSARLTVLCLPWVKIATACVTFFQQMIANSIILLCFLKRSSTQSMNNVWFGPLSITYIARHSWKHYISDDYEIKVSDRKLFNLMIFIFKIFNVCIYGYASLDFLKARQTMLFFKTWLACIQSRTWDF